MPGRSKLLALPACVALLIAADQPWRDKKVPDWSVEDAKQVLDDSPWSRTVTPEMNRTNNVQRRGGMGRGGGVSLGIPGIGGMGRRGGMGGGGYPGGGYPSGGGYPGGRTASGGWQHAPTLKLRWESALPIREAELKARETNAPTVDEDLYALAVYGIPARMLKGESNSDLKKHAALKRKGKKDLKPSNAEILQREDGPVVLYFFPRTAEITRNDGRVEVQAQIGNLKLKSAFPLEDMVFQGHLEL